MAKDWMTIVRALLDKASASEFEPEREMFEAKALKLIAEHGLDKDAINRMKRGQTEFKILRIPFTWKQNYTPGKWADFLVAAVMTFTGVHCVAGVHSNELIFIGAEDKAQLASELFSRWEAELKLRCAADSKQCTFWHKDKNPTGIHRKVWRSDYMFAACGELALRIQEVVNKTLDHTTKAIVLDEQAAAREYGAAELNTCNRPAIRKNKVLASAKTAGERAAHELDIQSKLED